MINKLNRVITNKNQNISVTYLGKRGAGAEFTVSLIKYFEKTARLHSAVVSSDIQADLDTSKYRRLPTPHKLSQLYKFPLFIYRSLNLRTIFVSKGSNKVIIPMASPTDIFLMVFYKFWGAKIVLVIHDLEHHMGDKWPKKNSVLKRIYLADGICFLSNSIADKYQYLLQTEKYPMRQHVVLSHPVFPSMNDKVSPIRNIYGPYVLVIGRVREYKGILPFLVAWKSRTIMLDYKLIIAGEGKLETDRISDFIHDDVILINHWLTNEEFMHLIQNSKIVALPYLEATQSGVIPAARFFNKIILASDLEGLREQLRDYPSRVLFSPMGDPLTIDEILIQCEGFIDSTPIEDSKAEGLSFDVFAKDLTKFIDEMEVNGAKP